LILTLKTKHPIVLIKTA